jgi:chaperonin GroEL (HSP60 family)
MASKHLLFRAAAREKVLHGATTLADAVRVTLGPKSKCVLIEKKWGKPIVCNDGVTIAKEVELKDPEENLGARMIREAAEKTGDAVGDGTSTSTILAHAIYAEGLKNVAAGASAVDLKHGLDGGVVVGQMRTGKGNYGFDAAAGLYVDLVETGIIDPTKVVRVALENAVSVASVLLLTEATLTELPEEEREGERAAGLPEV